MYNNTDALILGEEGVIEGAFGTTGKFRLNMPGKESLSCIVCSIYNVFHMQMA